MSSSSADIKQIEEFWNSHLCGKQFVNAKFPSKEFFDNYRHFRYTKTHHLNRYIDWQSAREKDVLEIGLGIGADATRWAAHAGSYTGVDLTPEAVEATKTHLKHMGLSGKILQANAEALPFQDRSFDLVYSHGVLHHTGDIQKTFYEVHRVLKENGRFIVMLYSKASFNYWIRIQLYFRLKLLFLILKSKTGLRVKGDWALHVKNFKKDGWSYLSWKNFPHHCTDGPDCYVANIYYFREMKAMLGKAGFLVERRRKAHFPLGARFPGVERFIGALMGFHQLIWLRKKEF
jgi:ubiquinone/menaquinone biosynthesis C-methylase UbiE